MNNKTDHPCEMRWRKKESICTKKLKRWEHYTYYIFQPMSISVYHTRIFFLSATTIIIGSSTNNLTLDIFIRISFSAHFCFISSSEEEEEEEFPIASWGAGLSGGEEGRGGASASSKHTLVSLQPWRRHSPQTQTLKGFILTQLQGIAVLWALPHLNIYLYIYIYMIYIWYFCKLWACPVQCRYSEACLLYIAP